MPSQMSQTTQQSTYISSPMVPMSSQLPHHSRDAQVQPAPHQMLAPTTFMETAPFMAAIPVQPVIATPPFGPTVIQQLPHTSSLDYLHSNVILTPAQNQIQDQLQRKHEELQHLIQQQQDELRRVSEQLMIARYGVIPGVVNVGVPYSNSNSPTIVDNRYMGNLTPNQTQTTLHHTTTHLQMPHPMMQHSSQQQQQQHTPNPSTSDRNSHIHQFPSHPNQHSEQSNSSTDLPPTASQEYIQLEMPVQQQQQHQMQQMMATASTSTVMPGQTSSARSTNSDVLPFQMNQEQAQSLFSGHQQDRSVITSTASQNIHQTK